MALISPIIRSLGNGLTNTFNSSMATVQGKAYKGTTEANTQVRKVTAVKTRDDDDFWKMGLEVEDVGVVGMRSDGNFDKFC